MCEGQAALDSLLKRSADENGLDLKKLEHEYGDVASLNESQTERI